MRRAKRDKRFALFVFGMSQAALFDALRFALLFCAARGTAGAEDYIGKHDEVKRDPAAITSLSAACRCASRPPSDPSVQIPPIKSPVRNDRASCFLAVKSEEKSQRLNLHLWTLAGLRSRSSLITHYSLLFALGRCSLAAARGTAGAEDYIGKHDEVKRAPAAITSLSAACRCASRLPSDPSVQSPLSRARSEMTGLPAFIEPA
ncbi:MAG: hypothetical protein ACXWID_04050 [Pyrinomonadaceae bacterium]